MDPGLDFASLLGLAEHVSTSKDKKDARPTFLKTKFEPVKKEKKEKGKLNVNVRKFLEKKEAEERAKKIADKEKLKNLQELRDDRSKNKIAKHLKVTKSANKAVISEAINERDTSVTMTGRAQCDEDDYGFCSNTSNSIYEKLMGKYDTIPDDPMAKFSKAKPKAPVDIARAKERMKEALKKQEEEETAPRTRKRKSGGSRENYDDDTGINYTRTRDDRDFNRHDSAGKNEEKTKSQREKEKEQNIRKRKELAKKAPKPMDFTSLLQMANTVKDKPVTVQKKKEIKEFDVGDRPMTKRQKEEWIRENEAKLRREGKLPPKEVPGRIPKLNNNSSSSSSSKDNDRHNSSSKSATPPLKSATPPPAQKVRRPEPGPSLHPAVLKTMKKPPVAPEPSYKKPASDNYSRNKEADRRDYERRKNGSSSSSSHSGRDDKADKIKEEKRRLEELQREKDEENRKLKEKIKAMEAQLAKSSSKTSDSRSKSSSNGKRSFNEVEARRFPGEKVRKEEKRSKDKSRKANRIESESEYDSEMDDFIDDGDAGFDISKEIRNIFGYDRNRYRDEPDFDDRSMENNKYSSIMQEEVRSAKIGRMEDLEDMRREEMEKKRKLQKLKSKKR